MTCTIYVFQVKQQSDHCLYGNRDFIVNACRMCKKKVVRRRKDITRKAWRSSTTTHHPRHKPLCSRDRIVQKEKEKNMVRGKGCFNIKLRGLTCVASPNNTFRGVQQTRVIRFDSISAAQYFSVHETVD